MVSREVSPSSEPRGLLPLPHLCLRHLVQAVSHPCVLQAGGPVELIHTDAGFISGDQGTLNLAFRFSHLQTCMVIGAISLPSV